MSQNLSISVQKVIWRMKAKIKDVACRMQQCTILGPGQKGTFSSLTFVERSSSSSVSSSLVFSISFPFFIPGYSGYADSAGFYIIFAGLKSYNCKHNNNNNNINNDDQYSLHFCCITLASCTHLNIHL